MAFDSLNVAKSVHLNPGKASSRPWLDNLVKPSWLKNDIYEDFWKVSDTNRKKQKNLTIHWRYMLSDGTWLTDPMNVHLLETAQLFAYWSRMDVDPVTNSGTKQRQKVAVLKTFMSWVKLNGYTSLGDLIPEDFEAYMEDLSGGAGCLLNYEQRLDRYIEDKRQKGEAFPVRKKGIRKYELDVPILCEELGMDFLSARNVDVFVYGISQLRKEEGLYLKPKYLEMSKNEFDDEDDTNKTYGWMKVQLCDLYSLWHYKDKVGDMLKFDPFRRQSPSEMAKSMFENGALLSKRTGTIPIEQASFLVDRALRWVLDYGEQLLQLRDHYDAVVKKVNSDPTKNHHQVVTNTIVSEFQKVLDANNPWKEMPGQPWPMDARLRSDLQQEEGCLKFYQAINRFLPVACAIVIAFFVARRYREVTSIRARTAENKYALQFDEEGIWLECWIEKIVQDWDRFPAPKAVKKAVKLLRRWSYPARRITGRPELFQCKAINSDEIVEFNFGQALKEFAKYINVPSLEDGSKWIFKPHQLRRLFVIMFYWRWDLGRGDLTTLQYQLRHLDPAMTRHYATECKPGRAFHNAHTRHDHQMFVEVRQGKRDVSGQFGDRFKEAMNNIVNRLRKNLDVVSPRVVDQRLAKFLAKSNKASVPLPWGYCWAEKDKNHPIAGALCHQVTPETNLPRLENAEPLLCADCPRFMSSSTLRGYWDGLLATEDAIAHNENNSLMMRKASMQRAEAFRSKIDVLFKNTIASEVIQ